MRYFFLLTIMLSCLQTVGQHTGVYSQYMFNGMAINPAYTGSREALSITAGYRNQWTGFEGAPVTQTVSAHTPLKKEKIALGLLFYRDALGVSKENGFHATYAYRMQVHDGKLSLGLGSGVTVRRSDWTQLRANDTDDEVLLKGNKAYLVPDFSFGALYYTDKYHAGMSLPFFLTHSYEEQLDKYRVNNKINNYNLVTNGGARFEVSENFILKPSLLWKMHFSSGMQFDLNMNVAFNKIMDVGISFRTGDAVVGLVQVKPTPQLLIGYSYDYTLSRLSGYNNGTHEIFIRYDFRYRIESTNPRFF